jgi:hypothetical protein
MADTGVFVKTRSTSRITLGNRSIAEVFSG